MKFQRNRRILDEAVFSAPGRAVSGSVHVRGLDFCSGDPTTCIGQFEMCMLFGGRENMVRINFCSAVIG